MDCVSGEMDFNGVFSALRLIVGGSSFIFESMILPIVDFSGVNSALRPIIGLL